MMKRLLIAIFMLMLPLGMMAAPNPTASTPKELRIIRVTPEGADVPAGRQIVIEFNRPVVPLGQMQRSVAQIPASFTPTVACQWRWLSSTALACNLDSNHALTPATRYTLIINPGIKAHDGATIKQAYRHQFTTQRPDILSVWVDTWDTPGTPAIKLSTTLPVTQESLQHSLKFLVSSPENKTYPAQVTPDLTANDEAGNQSSPSNDGRRWLVTTQEELPLGANVSLRLQPGLLSTLGPEKAIGARELLALTTFPEFAFLGIQCENNAGKMVLITPEKPQPNDQLCNPLASVALVFNAPVAQNAAAKNLAFSPALPSEKNGTPWQSEDAQDSEDNNETPYIPGDHRADSTYNVWLPSVKAAQKYTISIKPQQLEFFVNLWHNVESWFKPQPNTNLQDAFGRKLFAPMTLTFATDHRKPNFVLGYHDAVLEKNVDSEVPLYVNNLQTATFNYRSLTPETAVSNQSITQQIPAVADVQFAVPLGVRNMLHGSSGAVFGQLTTIPSIDKSPHDSHLFAQVTPFQVQVKLGHFNTLIWVTDFATGKAVANAKIIAYQDALTTLSTPKTILATAVTDAQGLAFLPGTQVLDPDLSLTRNWKDEDQKLFIRIDMANDMALLPLSYDYAIDTWRVSDGQVYGSNQPRNAHLLAWGITAQGIYRVGDTIQYKFYVRNQNNERLIPAPVSGYTLQIVDPTNKVVSEVKDIKLSAFGDYSGEFTTAKNAAVGWYQFRLLANFNSGDNSTTTATAHTHEGDENQSDDSANTITLNPMRVLVSDFTPAAFKVSNDLNGDLFHSGQEVTVTSTARLHSGGPYTDAQARVTAILNNLPFTSKNPLAANYSFSNYGSEDDNNMRKSLQIYQQIAPLNNKGELISKFTIPKQNIIYGQLKVESAVMDERGKYVATQSQADYAGADRYVGLLATQWLYNAKQPATIKYLVVDDKGNPVAGTAVNLLIERQITNAARIKDAGNAYTWHYTSSWQQESQCQGTSQTQALNCEFTPQQAGDYRITAKITDSKGTPVSAQLPIWVVGKDYVLWNEASDNYLQIKPEKTSYHVGDTARFIIKNPWPGALALITVERYGVLDYFVKPLTSSAPVIEIPIKSDYLPGFYLSVTIFSPRVDKPLENGQVDLGKPTFRMGYVTVPVKDAYKEMRVTIKTDRPVYRPRDTVTLQLHAEPKMPTASAEPIQLTVAVLDESVFALLVDGLNYYNPYSGFYQLDNLDMSNYSLLTRLVGRQKFEKKGANPGGDGGLDLGTRNFFKFLSYWNTDLKTDAQGNATVQFIAPDNLTGWRVLALAVTPTDRMGLGDANFKVNRPTELRPVMPNQISEGDDFKAGFNLLNRTDKTRTLTVNINAQGDIDSSKTPNSFTQTLTLAPYQRGTVWMPIQAGKLPFSRDNTQGVIHFHARAGDENDADAIDFSLPVVKIRSLETASSYGTTTDAQVTEDIAVPKNIYTDIGDVTVTLAPSIINNVEGAFRYMRDYLYICWEQKLTKGVMAAEYLQLKNYIPSSFSWSASKTLPDTTLNAAADFQAPNGGMAYFQPTDDYADPYLSAYTALGFNWLRQEGYVIPEQVETKLQAYLLNYLRHDIAADYYTASMNATVRAVALAALAERGKITLADLRRYQAAVPSMSLFGKANFIQAALHVPNGQAIALAVAKTLVAQSNQTAGKFIFSEELDDSYARILSSPLRDNCAILSAFTALASTPSGTQLVGDIPFKLLRTIIQSRNGRDHWQNTQENIFCMHALADYSRAYENTAPNMSVAAHLADQLLGTAQFQALSNPPQVFKHQLAAEDAGRNTQITLDRQGAGRLYYTLQLSYASLNGFDQDVNAGIEIHREYSVQRNGQWQLLHNPLAIKRGELVRVDIYLSLPAARNFVVVNDPIPGGLEPVNRDLATSASLDARNSFQPTPGSMWFKSKNWTEFQDSQWSFYHQELRNDSAQFYADYLPAGNYHLSYTAQAIAAGKFTVMPIFTEEMYDPNVFGKGSMAELNIN